MTITLYCTKVSVPSYAVKLTAAALGLELDVIDIDLTKGEQLKPEFIRINPQHTVPTLVDENGYSIWESRAIIFYLAEKYGKGKLIPNDVEKRATLIQRLHFDSSLFSTFGEYYGPVIMKKQPPNDEKFKKMENTLGFLDTFLAANKYVAGDQFTIADCSLISIISTFEAVEHNFEKCPNIIRWYKLMKDEAPGMEISTEWIQVLKEYFGVSK